MDIDKAIATIISSNPAYENLGLSEEDHDDVAKKRNAIAILIGTSRPSNECMMVFLIHLPLYTGGATHVKFSQY